MRARKRTNFFILVLGLLTASCLPEQSGVRRLDSQQANSSNAPEDSSTPGKVTSGISEVNFFQQGQTSSTGTLSLFADFKDSFLMRGDNIHNYLQDHVAGTQKRICVAFGFPTSTGVGSKKVLALAGAVRSYHNSQLGGREYYLQMQVSNETANVNDCLNVNLTNALQGEFGSNSIAFKIADVCPSCKTNISSDKALFFSSTGSLISDIQKQNLGLRIMPSLGSTAPTGVTCQTDSACKVEGFNCCLENQCVNHGEVKTSVDTSSEEYLVAVEQILSRPELIKNYQDIFYICPEMIPADPDNGNDDPDLDPIQQADDLFEEMEDLYQCLNPVIDEFAVCSATTSINTSQIGQGGTTLSAGKDDLTFQSVNFALNHNNVVSVEYAGGLVYKSKLLPTDQEIAPKPGVSLGVSNDNLSFGQSVTVDMLIPAGSVKNSLKVAYRVDGTCERLGTGLARCVKYYTQGQSSSPPRSSDHPSGNNNFKLPSYANFNYNILVEVSGVKIAPGDETWQPDSVVREVQFTGGSEGMSVFNNQDVKITYFVTQNVDQLLYSKEIAQTKVNDHCNCGEDIQCNLKPVYETVNSTSELVSFSCVYPQPDTPDSPLQETVYLSAKSVPHRYYDADGVHYEDSEMGAAQPQEGEAFKYVSDNILKPNNQSKYIGFNEIYGSFDKTEISAMPAKVVHVVKGKQYDLFVDSGSFSTCLNCGTDYFSNLQKLFPNNFLHMGGGYLPDMVESRLRSNKGPFSSVNMKFGRACFVPATMIPWTHKTNDDIHQQRRDRLKAQHFLFANGYNKDWYGFDYGSLIGSYDGVKWFSVGNHRRTQAKSNKLFLAINAYFGDLTIDNSFKVVVSEMSPILNSGSSITHDTESDGAQCQKAHFCSTDNDCMAQLGYEYTCQNVSGLYTPWPFFDNNGNEISGSNELSLLGLAGGSNGQVKRCVYRGSGSICEPNLNNVSASFSYSSTDNPAVHACSFNTHCAGLDEAKFNDRISRYGDTPSTQNNQSFITNVLGLGDTFGLDANIIGRPLDLYGSKNPPAGVKEHLESINSRALCVPGKNPENSAVLGDLNNVMTGARKADKAMGIGRTFSSSILRDPAYYAACPAVNEDDKFTHTIKDPDLNDFSAPLDASAEDNHAVFASAQNLSTNALDLPAFDVLNLFNDGEATMSRVGYQKGACLRAPGSSCFTDYDCSPNSFISQKIKSLSNLDSVLNQAEQNFWKEELVCANSQERYLPSSIYPNPYYELNQHKCCRETGKDFTYYTQKPESEFKAVDDSDPNRPLLLPGVSQDINSFERYSRTHTVYDKLVNEDEKYPPLYAPGEERIETVLYSDLSQLLQYNTLHLNNSRMCCTGHWVRNFATGTNGNNGGHKFSGQTQQRIPITTFKTLNWSANNVPHLNNFEGNYEPWPFICNGQDYATADCEIKNIPEGSDEEKKFLSWFAKFELIGIPQVMIEANTDDHQIYLPLDEFQKDKTADEQPLPNTIQDVNDAGRDVDAEVAGLGYYSAASYDNLKINSTQLKKVFSEDSFSCCVPTGIEVDGSMPDSKCCSGQVHTENQISRCCLNDFTDVSVYTNRYVSSEGAYVKGQPVSDSDIDPYSGYIRKEIVLEMAANMCCSGAAAYGVALGDYYIPLDGGGKIENAKTRRWLYIEDLDDANEVGGGVSKFNAGMKWNNHVYCVPPELAPVQAGSGSTSGGSSATQN